MNEEASTREQCANCTRTLQLNNSFSFEEKIHRNKWFKMGMVIGRYWFISMFPVMFTRNILSFLVMNQKHNRKSSTCTYMAVIVIGDNAVLVCMLSNWISSTFQLDLMHHSHCKYHIYFFIYFGHIYPTQLSS